MFPAGQPWIFPKNAPDNAKGQDVKVAQKFRADRSPDAKTKTGIRRQKRKDMAMRPINKKRIQNWWYYNKWYVIVGAIVVGVLIDIVGNALGIFTKKPDFQIAYVSDTPLSDEAAAALENAFTEVSDDFNGDGVVIVRLNRYITGGDAATSAYGSAGEIQLMSDLAANVSYFFVTDDPEKLQETYQLFADVDGNCPEEGDFSVSDKVIRLADCQTLADRIAARPGTAEKAGELRESDLETLLELYLGRRCFYTEEKVDSLEKCNELWDTFTE